MHGTYKFVRLRVERVGDKYEGMKRRRKGEEEERAGFGELGMEKLGGEENGEWRIEEEKSQNPLEFY